VIFFARANGRFQTDAIRQLAERSDVGNDHCLTQSQRAHKRAGVFADGGITQVQDNVTGRHVTDELFDGAEAQDPHMGRKAEGLDQRFEREFRMRLAHQNHLHSGLDAHQPAERAQRFGDALVRLEKSENADQRCDFV
jgi:hypothetical protein